MSKALVFLVENVPHREHGEDCDGFPPMKEVERKLREVLRAAAAEPLGRHSDPKPRVSSAVVDPEKLQILARVSLTPG